MTKCPVCGVNFQKGDYESLAKHISQLNGKNDPFHAGFIKDYVPMDNPDSPQFPSKLKAFFQLPGNSLSDWMASVFVNRFYGDKPHQFMETMQRPKKSIFLGFGVEYYFFLKQKIKSLSYVIAKTNYEDVQKFEARIITPELLNDGKENPSQMSLLFKMCETLGVNKDTIATSSPLPPTLHSVKLWGTIAETDPWIEVMASMNPLDLLYSPKIKEKGAKTFFYGDSVLTNEWIPDQAKQFLSFMSDPYNDFAFEGLKLLEKYGKELDATESVQAVFIRSIDALDRHLVARVTRARQYEGKA